MKGPDADTWITMHERLEGQIGHGLSQTCIVLKFGVQASITPHLTESYFIMQLKTWLIFLLSPAV